MHNENAVPRNREFKQNLQRLPRGLKFNSRVTTARFNHIHTASLNTCAVISEEFYVEGRKLETTNEYGQLRKSVKSVLENRRERVHFVLLMGAKRRGGGGHLYAFWSALGVRNEQRDSHLLICTVDK